MSLESFNLQTEAIICNSQMSSSATITYGSSENRTTKTINGFFGTGTDSNDAPSSNAPRRGVRWDSFRVSRTQLFSLGITDPIRQLRKAHLVVNNIHFGVLEVRGADNELLTLNLRPEKDPNAEEEL